MNRCEAVLSRVRNCLAEPSFLLPGEQPFLERMGAQLEVEHWPSWDELDRIEVIWRRVIPEALNQVLEGYHEN